MKIIYPTKYHGLLKQVAVSFDPFGTLNDRQFIALIDAVEAYLTDYGVDDSGEELNELGMLCEDFLFWIAKQE